MSGRLNALLLFALAALVVSCSDESDAGDDPVTCETGTDCPSGVCDDGVCAPEDDADVGGDVSDVAADGSGDAADGSGDGGDAADGSGDGGDAGDTDDEETTPPPLAFVTDPENGATYVPLDVTITVRFNQAMNELRFFASNISLQTAHGTALDRVIEYDPETFTLSVGPPEEDGLLRPATPYEFRLAEEISASSGEDLGEPFRMTFSTTGYPGRVFLRQLAEAYAPRVYQQVETPALDTFTRIDFDGNLTPADNLDHTTGANYGYVYYDVIETLTHYFVSYMFYYPGSIPRAGTEYEHDIFTLQVVVRKTDDDPLGELRAFSTFYHENLSVWAVESGWYDSGDAPGSNEESIDGRLPAGDLLDGRHVSLFVESGRHAVCLPTVSTTEPPCAPDRGSETAPFEPDTVGLVYQAAEAGQRMGDAANDALTYALRSFVEDFWALRARVDGEEPVFGGEYAYHPPTVDEEAGTTRPGDGQYFPTALNAENEDGHWGDLPFVVNVSRERTDQGVWFVDPAWANHKMYDFPEAFSAEYCFNPYLDIDIRSENDNCTDPDFALE